MLLFVLCVAVFFLIEIISRLHCVQAAMMSRCCVAAGAFAIRLKPRPAIRGETRAAPNRTATKRTARWKHAIKDSWAKSEDLVVSRSMYSMVILCQSVWSIYGSEEGEAFLSWIINPGPAHGVCHSVSTLEHLSWYEMEEKLHYFTFVLTYMLQYKTE